MTIRRDAPTFTVQIGPVRASFANTAQAEVFAAGQQQIAQGAATLALARNNLAAGSKAHSAQEIQQGQVKLDSLKKVVPASPGPLAYVFTATPVDVTDRVTSFEFDDDDQKADELKLTLDNFELDLFDDPNWKHGNGLIVAWGYAGNLCLPRTLVIQKITGAHVMQVTALSVSIAMNKIKQSKTFENMKRSAIIAAIATSNGFGPDAQFIDDSEVTIPHTHQARMTDAEFMAHLAAKEGFVFYVGPDGLHWERRKTTSAPTRTFTYYNDPSMGDIIDFGVEHDVTTMPGLVESVGRDPLAKTTHREQGSNSATSRTDTAPVVYAAVSKVNGVVTVHPATPTAAASVVISNAHNAQGAKREADGKYVRSQQAGSKLWVEAVGDQSIAAKQVIEVLGISKKFSGRYYVKNVKHKLSASGSPYTMRMTIVSNGTHGSPGAAAVPTDAHVNTKNPADPKQLNTHQVSKRTGEVTYKPNGGQGQ